MKYVAESNANAQPGPATATSAPPRDAPRIAVVLNESLMTAFAS